MKKKKVLKLVKMSKKLKGIKFKQQENLILIKKKEEKK